MDKIQVDDICYEAKRVLDEVDYTDKDKSVKTLLDKVTIKEGGWVNVCGHIPLFTQKLGYELKSRNAQIQNQHLSISRLDKRNSIPFKLIINL